jgi:hypothetical protein
MAEDSVAKVSPTVNSVSRKIYKDSSSLIEEWKSWKRGRSIFSGLARESAGESSETEIEWRAL